MLAGRGFGKTRAGAEWVADQARRFPGCRIALIGQTFSDVRDTMVEGESGLLSVLEIDELRGGSVDDAWNRSLGELFLANGSRFKAFSSEKPRQLRGPQHHFAWGDEPATWFDAPKGPAEDTTFSNLVFGCRLTTEGEAGQMSEPRIMLTGTPKPIALLTKKDEDPKGLLHRDGVVITKGHSDENVENLAPTYRAQVIEPLRNTRLGRQELAAELLEDVPGALWSIATIREHRASGLPPGGWQSPPRIGVDLADGLADGDEQAYTVVGHSMNDHLLYVVESDGLRLTPAKFAREVILRAHAHKAIIVMEINHGGAWAEEVFQQVMREIGLMVPIRVVRASQGKRTRAEPVATLYERGKVRHVGEFSLLESQMTSFTGAGGEKSPDRLDSLVWALTDFVGYTFGPPPKDDGGAVPYTEDSVGTEDGLELGAVSWR